ncbi:helix-turn-helix domain-containing protein [Chryseobacterium sp. SIMBA_029]|uniref:helix-turn-helix domain-containing protein n=1 Tax=Chryseobacterium sp. SIMBA_029 TaxID=3085772 RepID=UPI00397880F3
MKSTVQLLREEKHLTQTELAEKAGLSLRTIQRMEAGNTPRGFTLKALAAALEVDPQKLIENKESAEVDRAKLINLSALAGVVIPFGGIIFPLLLTYKTKDSKSKELGKNIIGIQIILAFIVSVVMIISPFIQKVYPVRFPLFIIPLIGFICVKISVIILNGISLNTKGDLRIGLKTSFL